MSSDSQEQKWTMVYKLSVGFFAFMLFVTLLYIHTAEKAVANQDWYLKLSIVGPWIFCLLIGLTLYLQVRRKQVSEEVAQYVIGTLGMVLMFAYDAIFELAKFVR